MIEVNNVTRAYGNFLAVDGVSFEIGSKEIVGLLGHNGAGKTTIMKMMTGFLEPTEGRILIGGHDVWKQRRAIQQMIGYLPENCPLYPEMAVAEYLEYTAALHNVPTADRERCVVEAMVKTGLQEKALQPISTLSRGFRQRTGVAQAILHNPEILILDEPTNGLDPNQILQMRELIRDLARSATVIVSTHILQEVQAVCDRVIILNNGKKVVDSRLDELRKGARLLLEVTGSEDAETVISRCEGVKMVDRLASDREENSTLAVLFEDGVDRRKGAAELAKTLHQQGFSLFRMEYESRNLESVFAEVTSRSSQQISTLQTAA